jgi:predicted MFS family arabinose efflux permease
MNQPILHLWERGKINRRFLRLAIAVFLFNAGYSLYLFLYNFWLSADGQHEGRMGALASATVLGGILGALPTAKAANRWGGSRTMTWSLLACGVVLGFRLYPAPFFMQWALALISGCFLCGWTVLIFPLIAAVSAEHERASAFQFLFGLATGAGCVGAIVGGYLPGALHVLYGLTAVSAQRASLLLGAVVICLSTLAIPAIGEGGPIAHLQKIRTTEWRTGILALSALWALLLGALNPFSGIYFQNQFQMKLPAIGGFFFVVQAATAIGLMVIGSSRLSRVPQWGLFASAQLVVAMTLEAMSTHSLPVAETGYLLFMFSQQIAQPALQSLLLRNTTEIERNKIAAWNAIACATAQAIAAQFAGLLWASWGYSAALPFLALATALTAVVSAISLRNPGRAT